MKTLLVIFVLASFCVSAQNESFDIASYQAPAGWTKQITDYAVSFSKVDQSTGTWCQIGLYKSVASSGDATADFRSEWKALVKGETYSGATEPLPTATITDGWTLTSGTSKFKWNGKDSKVSVRNFSGYGTMVSVVVSMNSDKYITDADQFTGSIRLNKPAQQHPTQKVAETSGVMNAPSEPIKVTAAAGSSGIATSTTNFNDGWTAQPFADYVMVTRQSTTVLLHYAIAIDDGMRRAENMALALWEKMIAPRYRTTNVRVFQNEPYTYSKTWFAEAEAVELASGKSCYIGFRILVANGIAHPIEIIVPNAATLQSEFPDQTKIENMTGYNKFAISLKDVQGTWEESSSTGVNMYNINTGAYAGMNMTASADKFEFKGDGTYTSNHKGATGMVGSINTFDQKYNGKYLVTPWDMTITNRFEGKTEVYAIQYEAVRGGRVLQMVNKQYSGMKYQLVKTK